MADRDPDRRRLPGVRRRPELTANAGIGCPFARGAALAAALSLFVPGGKACSGLLLSDVAEIADLKRRGVEVEGVMTLTSGLRRAFFQDPDGNITGMRQL